MGFAFGIGLSAILSKIYDNIVIEVSFVFTSCYLVYYISNIESSDVFELVVAFLRMRIHTT